MLCCAGGATFCGGHVGGSQSTGASDDVGRGQREGCHRMAGTASFAPRARLLYSTPPNRGGRWPARGTPRWPRQWAAPIFWESSACERATHRCISGGARAEKRRDNGASVAVSGGSLGAGALVPLRGRKRKPLGRAPQAATKHSHFLLAAPASRETPRTCTSQCHTQSNKIPRAMFGLALCAPVAQKACPNLIRI